MLILEKNILLDCKPPFATSDKNLAVSLLKPTRLYHNLITQIIKSISVKGIAHITGGGLIGNLPRIIPKQFSIELKLKKLPKDNLFTWFKNISNMNDQEMLSTFNCGIGMAVIVPEHCVDEAVTLLMSEGETASVIGEVVKGSGQVHIPS